MDISCHMTVVLMARFMADEYEDTVKFMGEVSLVMYAAVRLFVIPLIQTLCSHRLRGGFGSLFGIGT